MAWTSVGMTFLFIQEAFTKHLLRIVHNIWGNARKTQNCAPKVFARLGRWRHRGESEHSVSATEYAVSRADLGLRRARGGGGGGCEQHPLGASCRRRCWKAWEGARPSGARRPRFQNKMSCSQVRCGRAAGSLGDSWLVRLLGAVVQNGWQLQRHPTEKAPGPGTSVGTNHSVNLESLAGCP